MLVRYLSVWHMSVYKPYYFYCKWLKTKKSFVTSYIIFVKLYLGSKISVLGDILYGKTMIL